MELHEALSQISEIRKQMAQTETFRGYRAMTAGFSAALALVAGTVQAIWMRNPMDQIGAYLMLWIAVAVISVVTTGAEMVIRSRRAQSPLTVQLTWLAVQQFLPCLAAGGLLTYVLVLFSPESIWMFPGLWAILFSLGVFASCRLLPRPIIWAGSYYLVSGIVCLAVSRGDAALSPWTMIGTFGIGQLLIAAILYFTLEGTSE